MQFRCVFFYKQFLLVCFLLLSTLTSASNIGSIKDSLKTYNKELKSIQVDKLSNIDQNYIFLKKAYNFYKKHNRPKVVSCLITLSDIAWLKRHYVKSFDYLWEAMYIAKQQNNEGALVVIHRKLSLLYDTYDMPISSLNHLQTALEYSKKIDTSKNEYQKHLNVSYYRMAIKERNLGDYEKSLAYLDSCKISKKLENSNSWLIPSIENEKAKAYIELKEFDKAQHSIDIALSRPLAINPSNIKSLAYFRTGELYEKKKDTDSAIIYFKKSLLLLKKSKNGLGHISNANYKLAQLYLQKKQYRKAYKFLYSYKTLTDSINKAKTIGNEELFRVRNSYHEKLLNNEIIIKSQQQELSHKTSVQSRLKIIILLLVLLIAALSFAYWVWVKQRKLIAKKEKARLNAELEKEKMHSQVKLQSQELTSNVLQLIDKEETVKELLETIKELSPKTYQIYSKKHLTGSKQLWNEFNMRFTEVNSEFYNKLNTICPELSRTEQKHCALIKLNFSTKEMAQILNVEAQTVNMSRSRIRKKLGLHRSDNLSAFISSL